MQASDNGAVRRKGAGVDGADIGSPPGRGSVSARTVVAVAAIAGSGKTTLGRALARHLRLPLLDLGPVTNLLLDLLPGEQSSAGR